MIRMPQWMKDKWVKALRSGEYEQGRNILKDTHGRYCCLGVLQQVVDGDVERYADMSRSDFGRPLPTPSEEWCTAKGITGDASLIRAGLGWIPEGSRLSLMTLNDHGLHKFNQIADIIEKGVEGY